MLLWFAGMAVLLVWAVFKDPAIDYRLIMAGAVAPDVVDGLRGGPRELHTLAFAVAALVAVMAATRGREASRRRLLALPIGAFCHLILDGTWTQTATFWWPAFGSRFTVDGLPSFDRPLPLVLAMEGAGLAAIVFARRRGLC